MAEPSGMVADAPRMIAPQAGQACVPIEAVMAVFLRKAGFLLSRIDQIANAAYAGAGETLAQAEMLAAIAALDGSDQVGLARACGIDTSTAAIILDNLTLTGLIDRVQDKVDRRRSLPVLTAQGQARMAGVGAALDALQAELLDGIDADGRTALLALLGRIARDHGEGAPRWDMDGSPFATTPSLLFRRALQISHANFNACVAPHAITLRQFSALLILQLHPGLSQIAFARVFGLDPSTCAVVLKKLAMRGLLDAQRCSQDRRKTLYVTTGAGGAEVARVQPEAERAEALTLASLDETARARFVAMLQHIVRAHSGRLRYPGCLPWDEAG